MKRTPELPDSAWSPLARQYREAVAPSTEASDNYHLAVFLAVAGAALGRSVYYHMGMPVFPNFYVALYGESADARKGTAIRLGQQLLQEAIPDQICDLPGIGSSEGLCDALIEWQTSKKAEIAWGFLTYSELRILVEAGNRKGSDLYAVISEAYDCLRRLGKPTRAHPRLAEKPYITILGGSSPEWLEKMQRADLKGGLGNRFLWVAGEPKEPIEEPPAPDPAAWKRIVKQLRGVREFWEKKGPIRLLRSAEAKADWQEFYSHLRNHGADDELIGSLSRRMHTNALKMSIVNAALDKSLVIERHHQAPALRFAGFQLECLYYIFSEYGIPDAVRLENKLEADVTRFGGKVRRRKLQMLNQRMGTESFNRTLKFMLQERALIEATDERGGKWILSNPVDDAGAETAPETAAANGKKPPAAVCYGCGYNHTVHELRQSLGPEKFRDKYNIEGVCDEYREQTPSRGGEGVSVA